MLRSLAGQGHAPAQNNLGAMYAKGEGVPRDDAEAVTWFRRAAEQGDARAQVKLGLMTAEAVLQSSGARMMYGDELDQLIYGDYPYYLDLLAAAHLPAGSRAAWGECATGLDEYVMDNPRLPEAALVARPIMLQARRAPAELVDGPFVSIAQCLTFRCTGIVSTDSLLFERRLDVNGRILQR